MSTKLNLSNSTYSSKTEKSLNNNNDLMKKMNNQLQNDFNTIKLNQYLKKERCSIFSKKITKIINILEYDESTFFLSLKIFDKYYSLTYLPDLNRSSILKIALVSLELASKINEIQKNSLKLTSFSSILPDFDLQELKKIEKEILFKLNFKINFYTGFDVLREMYYNSKEFSFINFDDQTEKEFFLKKLNIASKIFKNLKLTGQCELIDDFHLATFIFNIECQENWNNVPYKNLLNNHYVVNRSEYQKKIYSIKEVLYNSNAPMIF